MIIDENSIQKDYSWDSYLSLCEHLVAENKTTGTIQTTEYIHFTSLNLHRMKRVFKTYKVSQDDALKISESPSQLWILITEPWCGDAAQIVPVIARIAALNSSIHLRIILRDEHPEIMDLFLTNGGRAIPKLIALDPNSFKVNWHWGPRPQGASDVVLRCKNEGLDKPQMVLALQEWYNQDKGIGVTEELTDLV